MSVREEVAADVDSFRRAWSDVRGALASTLVGQEDVVEQVLTALFAGGHVLLEGVPGLGKTLLVRSLATALGLKFSRVQCTPDLMPADVTGTTVLMEEDGRRVFAFRPGPVFTNLLLVDEINRATPKTQSALLEVMEEHVVTVSGVPHRVEEPFLVLATQNPIEMEGTFPLPEAQMDRFLFKVLVRAPSHEELLRIVDRTTGAAVGEVPCVLNGPRVQALQALAREVVLEGPARDLVARLVVATDPAGAGALDVVKRYVRFGASPRGARSLALGAKVRALAAGRLHTSREDVLAVARPALGHRILLDFEGEAEGVTAASVLDAVLASVR